MRVNTIREEYMVARISGTGNNAIPFTFTDVIALQLQLLHCIGMPCNNTGERLPIDKLDEDDFTTILKSILLYMIVMINMIDMIVMTRI